MPDHRRIGADPVSPRMPDYEALRQREARAKVAVAYIPLDDSEGRALVQAIHDRKAQAMSKCIACTNDPKVTVKASDNIPLCGTHWNYWLSKYDPMIGEEPPCGAHLIRDVPYAAV